jgi:predicted transcriptional regulator
VPEGFDVNVYLVLEDYGPIGRAYRKIDEEKADRETLIRHLIEGQYEHVVRIVAFNTAQGWSRDVSTEIAGEVVERAKAKGEELTGPVRQFVDWELERLERRRAAQLP